MKTYKRARSALDPARAHPWTDAASNPESRYYDLKAEPWLVRTSLEDFTPWDGVEAVGTFYRLLEWLNAPGGALESNDCEFTGPHDNPTARVGKAQECSGRLMILYRDLPLNLSLPRVEWLEDAALRHLARIDPEFECGAVGTTIMNVQYVELPVTDEDQLGYQLMLSFWAWGDTEAETMVNLARLFENLSGALRVTSAEIA
jgi:hypothetical protein